MYSRNFTSGIFRPLQNETKNTTANNKPGRVEQSLKPIPVDNSSEDIDLHVAFIPTHSLNAEIPVQYWYQRTGPVLIYNVPVGILSCFMFHRKCLDP